MSERSLPVIAAIPNYNMAETLEPLLNQVAEQDYARIFVLDDASTDDSCREVAKQFGRDVTWVQGEENVGSGGNRNRIISRLEGRQNSIIHFLDADVTLETERTPEAIGDIMADEAKIAVGGLVLTEKSEQNLFNFGPRMSAHTTISAAVHMATWNTPALRKPFARFLRDWPDPTTPPEARSVFWMHEANMAIRSDTFSKLGGFNAELRDHDIQYLALDMEREGVRGRHFDPSFAVTQHTVTVRTGNRILQMRAAQQHIVREFGLRNHFLPDGHFRPNL